MESARLDQHPLLGVRPDGGPGGLAPQPVGPAGKALHVAQLVGGALIAGGIVSVVVAWFGISGTLDPGKQMPYLVSGGLGGALAVAIGVAMFVSDEHARDRDALAELLDRLDALDGMVGGIEEQITRLEREIVVQAGGAPTPPAKAPGPRATGSPSRVRPEAPARARSQGVRVSRGRGSGGTEGRER